MSSKATHEQLKRHNRHLLLQALYSGSENTRAALAQSTGLAKPTVSDIIAELMAEGFLIETGQGESTSSGGKRPILLQFVPAARQIIGVSLDKHRAFGVLTDLNGQISAEHYAENGDPQVLVSEVIGGLIAQLDAPLLCIGVGVPGAVDQQGGVVQSSAPLGWHNVHLGAQLQARFAAPVYVGNNTELAARARLAWETAASLVTLLINDYVEVGISLQADMILGRGGALHRSSGDVGGLRVGDAPLDALLGWEAVRQRATALGLPVQRHLDLRRAADQGDAAALTLYDELADHLSTLLAWVTVLIRPDHIALVGDLGDLGERLLNLAYERISERLLSEQPALLAVSVNGGGKPLSALGAAALALYEELGIECKLLG